MKAPDFEGRAMDVPRESQCDREASDMIQSTQSDLCVSNSSRNRPGATPLDADRSLLIVRRVPKTTEMP